MRQSTLTETSDFFAILLDVLTASLDFFAEIGHLFLVAQPSRIDAVNFTITGAAVAVFSTAVLRGRHGAFTALSGTLLVFHEVTVVVAQLVDVTTVAGDVPLFAVYATEVIVLGHELSKWKNAFALRWHHIRVNDGTQLVHFKSSAS